MRSYQHFGLTEEATKYLKEHVAVVPDTHCPQCGLVLKEKFDVISYKDINAFYDDGPRLNTYRLKDGGEVSEVLQAMPWSSGPCGFLCLEIKGQRMFEWSEEEISKA